MNIPVHRTCQGGQGVERCIQPPSQPFSPPSRPECVCVAITYTYNTYVHVCMHVQYTISACCVVFLVYSTNMIGENAEVGLHASLTSYHVLQHLHILCHCAFVCACCVYKSVYCGSMILSFCVYRSPTTSQSFFLCVTTGSVLNLPATLPVVCVLL